MNQINGLNKPNLFQRGIESELKKIPARFRDVLVWRYGLDDGKSKTLDEIGKKLGITRERVRQIANEGIKKIKFQEKSSDFNQTVQKMQFTLGEKNGIIKKEQLIKELSGDNPQEGGAVDLFLDCVDFVEVKKLSSESSAVVVVSGFDLDQWLFLRDKAQEVLKKKNETLTEKELVELLEKSGVKNLSRKTIFNYLEASEEIKKNDFGKWGLRNWGEISPKGTRERIHLIFKEMGKPLHFREVAELIDKHHLGRGKTNPQTVHNELIKDTRFVLIGRGIYALAQWGYKEGTVKDLLEDLLAKSTVPLKKEDILGQILKVRKVKKSTIVINLNNFFQKIGKDLYTAKR